MGSAYADNALTFLVHTLSGLYILVVMLRFILQIVRADFYNPLSQFIVRATNPPLVWLRRFIPGYGGVDSSAVVLMVALQLLALWLIFAIKGLPVGIVGLVVLSVAELLKRALDLFFFSILIQVVLSWVSPNTSNPVTSILRSLTEPLLRPARQVIPAFSGLDLSPLVVIIALKLGEFLVVDPIRGLGFTLG